MVEEKKLNKEQLKVVQYGSGPLLIIAGAGTGKTTVITERIKWLVSEGLAKPSEILALTFTEKAAREMEERVDVAMPMGYTQMWISTFHAFCDRILRNEILHIGLSSNYNLLTEAETIQFLRQNLFKFSLSYFRPLGNPNKFISGMIQHFSRLKDEDVSVKEYLEFAKSYTPVIASIAKQSLSHPEFSSGSVPKKKRILKQVQNDKRNVEIAASFASLAPRNDDMEDQQKYIELANAYETYEKLKIEDGVMDFSDLISYTLKLFRTRPKILRNYQEQFKFILIDEFQDTNYAQNELVKLISGKDGNITVVADDDQSIYRFRGAAIANVLQFRKDFPQSKIITLTQNYRSAQEILDRAYALIQNNNPDRLEVKEKIDKKLKSVRNIKGEKIEFIHTDRVENEAEEVMERILKQVQDDGRKYKDFTILVRANAHADPFIRALQRHGVPYQFLGPGMLFKQPEVKDLIAYLKLLANFEDSVSMYRVLCMDLFKINARDLAAINNFARKNNVSLFEACEQIEKITVSLKTKEKIDSLVKMIHRHLELVKKETAGQILYFFLQDSGLLQKLTKSNSAAEEKRAQNISIFFDKLKSYEANHEDASVFVISDWLDLSMELGESPKAQDTDWTEIDAVNILTVHSSKGLEFPVVFLVNLVANRFPTRERKEQIPIPQELIKEILPVGDFHLEEERRLFYVGMTRARDRLFLTASDYYGEGKRERKISPFVGEALGNETMIQSNKATKQQKQLSIFEWSKPTVTMEQSNLPAGRQAIQQSISYLSFSQISSFTTCPLQYRYRYVQKIPVAPSAALSFGDSVHKTLRDFYQKAKAGEKIKKDELVKLLDSNWSSIGYNSKAHEKKMRLLGEEILTKFYQRVDWENLPVALEQPFTIRVSPTLRVGGKIDRIDEKNGQLEIIDYKTGKMPEQKEIDHSLQMTIYALAATDLELYNKKPEDVTMTFYYLEPMERRQTTRTKEQLEESRKEIVKKAAAMEKSDFSPTPGKWCDFCEFKLICEAWS